MNANQSKFNLANIGISKNLAGYNKDRSVHVEVSYHVGRNQFIIIITPSNGKFFYQMSESLRSLVLKVNIENKWRSIEDEIFLTEQQYQDLIALYKEGES